MEWSLYSVAHKQTVNRLQAHNLDLIHKEWKSKGSQENLQKNADIRDD